MSLRSLLVTCLFFSSLVLFAQHPEMPGSGAIKFAQLGQQLPTPSETRLASGAPGPQYWQQRADYVIDVELDDERQRLIGSERITYHNQSPHSLKYI